MGSRVAGGIQGWLWENAKVSGQDHKNDSYQIRSIVRRKVAHTENETIWR